MPNNVMSNKYTFKTKTDKYYVYLILICHSKIYMIASQNSLEYFYNR